VIIWALDHGGGYERFLSLIYKICKKNKEDWTSVEKGLFFFEKLVFLIEINDCPSFKKTGFQIYKIKIRSVIQKAY
jgi:hypothetical protein